mgnify:CR=1 FL=1
MALTLRVPALGESIREATLGAWKHVEGDRVGSANIGAGVLEPVGILVPQHDPSAFGDHTPGGLAAEP